MRRYLIFTIAFGLLVSTSPAQAQQVNTTTGGVDYWGAAPIIQAGTTRQGWGQLFQVPATETYLESFSFWMRACSCWGDSQFQAHIGTWDGGTQSVSDIWTSPDRSVTSPSGGFEYTTLSGFGAEQVWNPGGLQLNANATYVAYLEVSNPGPSPLVIGDLAAVRQVAGGGARFFQNGVVVPNPSGLEGNMAFTATFTATPEPSAIILLATGLIGIGGMGWVRRRRTA